MTGRAHVLPAALALLHWPQAAVAQDAKDGASIVVTASRRATALIDTPMSLSVIDNSTLRATAADDFSDFAHLIPGLSYTDSGPGNKRYAIRGLQSAGEPEVALYYDEIPVSGLPGGALDTGDSQPDIRLWDVDRVEVLRGPQGTLYGNGSMGGAIRILSKRPVLNKVEAGAEASGAVTDGGAPSGRLSGMINLPILRDVLGIRLTGYFRHEGGWIDTTPNPAIKLPQMSGTNVNPEKTDGGRLSIGFQPSVAWNVTAIGYAQDTDTTAFDLYPAYAQAGDPYIAKTYVHTPWRDRIRMANVISTYQLGFATLTGSGAWQRRTLDRTTDTTRYLLSVYGCNEATWNNGCTTPATFPAGSDSRETVEAWSGEVRLASSSKGRLQWTVGGFYQSSGTSRRVQVAPTDSAGNLHYDSASGDAVGRLFERDNRDGFKQDAVFGEGSYEFLPRVAADVGLRWFHSDRSDQQIIVQQFFAGQPTGPQLPQHFSQSRLFQKYELSYKMPRLGLLYVQAAQGFRAGGPNYPGGFAVQAPPYRADSVWDYELGWKLKLEDARLYWTAAVFRIDWSNMQQLVPTALFNYIQNAGAARSEGFESELTYTPVRDLTLTSGLTYNNARLVGPQPVQSTPALQLKAGEKLANVPDWTANASVGYRFSFKRGSALTARLDGSYQSSRGNLVGVDNPAYFRIGSSALADMHLGWESTHPWRFGLDISNLFNTFAPMSAKALDSNLVRTVTAARPRTISLRADVSY